MPHADRGEPEKRDDRHVREYSPYLHGVHEFLLFGIQSLLRFLAHLREEGFLDRRHGWRWHIEIDPAMTIRALHLKIFFPRRVAAKIAIGWPKADHQHAAVKGAGVVVVAEELLGGEFPVAAQLPAMDSGHASHAVLRAIQDQIQIPAKVAEVFIQRDGLGVEVGEYQAAKNFHPRHFD